MIQQQKKILKKIIKPKPKNYFINDLYYTTNTGLNITEKPIKKYT